jgi:3-methyladenine DNA glycosylase Tag
MATSSAVKPKPAAKPALEPARAPSFRAIRERAARRKGGDKALLALLPKITSATSLAKTSDDRFLAEMTKRVFSAGFVWSVIENKWEGFEAAFLGFDSRRLLAQSDEFWEKLVSDTRIVRNGQKIMAVRANARLIAEISREHGGFGKFLAAWPAEDQVGLLDLLAKRGARLGGMTGQYLLRFVGKDGFVTSRDVVLCLRDSGLDIKEMPTSRKDLGKIQERFNAWAAETGLPRVHISRICAMSIGENYTAEQLQRYMGGEDE